MTRKEQKELAQKIVKYERMIQKSESKETIEFAENKINELITLSLEKGLTLTDMEYIDDLIQKSLAWF